MNSYQLDYLIELSKSPSINAASLKLHITPQALSTAIKKLEEKVGFTLLNRSFKGISLTDDGEWLVQEAASFFNKIEQRRQLYQTGLPGTRQGLLKLDINYSGVSDNILGQLICILYQQEPDLKISLEEKSKKEILDSVQSGSSEVGFIFRSKLNGAYTDLLNEELTFEPLFSGDMLLCVSTSSELAKFNTITMKKLTQFPLCSYNAHYMENDLIQPFITDSFNLLIQYECVNNFSIYKEKVRRGLANALLLYFPMEQHPYNYIEDTKMIAIRDDIKIYMGVVKKKDAILSENAIFFIQELKNMLQEMKENQSF